MTRRPLCKVQSFDPSNRPMAPAFGQDQRLDVGIGALWRAVGPMTARLQALEAVGLVAGQMLVGGLAADAKVLAQLGEREAVAVREMNESDDLFHVGYLVPGYTPYVYPISPV